MEGRQARGILLIASRAMRIASIEPARHAPAAPAAGPTGWRPETITAVHAHRRDGKFAGGWDAFRGVEELGNGQALSPVQVATLGTFLAGAFGMSKEQAVRDLEQVRLYVGGPAAARPFLAVQMDHSIYVGSEQGLERILSWEGRRWLTHELGHLMQWRRSPGSTDLARTRYGIVDYLVRMGIAPGMRPGAIPAGFAAWTWAKLMGEGISLEKAVHDAHASERETERHAQEFLAAHPA